MGENFALGHVWQQCISSARRDQGQRRKTSRGLGQKRRERF